MTASEHFNDSEMAAFFDTEMQKRLTSMRVEHEHEAINERLWAAIESLDMNLAIGKDPTGHKADFTALEEYVGNVIDSQPPILDPNYSRKEHVYGTARDIWDEESIMLEQISLAMDIQRYGNISDADRPMIKKWLMARLMTEEGDQTRWIELADAALDGDPLDTNNPDDFSMLTEALEMKANLENTPEAQFHNSILTLLGVPATVEEIPDDFDPDEIEHLIYAAREVTETVICNQKPSQQPERHSSIREILQTYCLIGEIDLETVFKLSDVYAESKATKQ